MASTTDAASLNSAGLAANKAGDAKTALAFFLQATALAPTFPPYLLSAANMFLKIGEATSAIPLYERARRELALNERQQKMVAEVAARSRTKTRALL